jgi:predicted nucleotidyltransferase/HEPN domain-containing protein
MKTSLDHLPEKKRVQLEAIAKRIRLDAPAADLILLFGSHARGDWVEDKSTGYRSDFDLLVVTQSPEAAADEPLWHRVEDAIRPIASPSTVTLLVYDLRSLNQELRRGQFFFVEIVAQGVVLFDANRFTLARPKGATPEERQAIAREYFEHWFGSANEYFGYYEVGHERGQNSSAAFQLHQATERYFAAALLVFTGTKPTTHKLDELSAMVAPLHPLLAEPFPMATEEDRHRFNLLRRAYIEARYKKSYRVTADELAALGERVKDLAGRVERACGEAIAAMAAPPSGGAQGGKGEGGSGEA